MGQTINCGLTPHNLESSGALDDIQEIEKNNYDERYAEQPEDDGHFYLPS